MIEGLFEKNGTWGSTKDHIHSAATKYFTEIFTSSHPTDLEDILAAVDPRVSESDNYCLLHPVTLEKFRVFVFQMGLMKAPGPNGMCAFFYQKFWHVVGHDVFQLVDN